MDRECAEVVFVSNEELEPKGETAALRAIRLRKRQGGLLLTAVASCILPCSATFGTGAGETDRVASRKAARLNGTRCVEE